MHRLSHLVDETWQPYRHPRLFSAGERVLAGVPDSDPEVFGRMLSCLSEPFHLLYVLHTPRGEAEPARYQSPLMSASEVEGFLVRFWHYLSSDSRFDLWAHSPSNGGTVVWDRHDQLFAYGPVEQFSSVLRSLGFREGTTCVPSPHQHHYRAEMDCAARELMESINWSSSPLRPEDEQ
jgi:hypothetical protein